MNTKENLNNKEQAYDAGYNDAISDIGHCWDDSETMAAYLAGYEDALSEVFGEE